MRNAGKAAVAVVALAALAAAACRYARRPRTLAIPPSYRGMTIPLSPDQAGWAKPGDRVDVYAGYKAIAAGRPDAAAVRIFENILVLGARRAGRGGEGSLLLALNPAEANYLTLLDGAGARLRIGIRGPGDIELIPLERASLRRLYGDEIR
jgi:Flp pilus assembly protein CpaB